MNASRLAVWIVGAAVSGAWLASAAGVTRQARGARVAPRSPEVLEFDQLAGAVQAQAGRLRDRLAHAPAPRAAERNPFSFNTRPQHRAAPARQPVISSAPVVEEVREPVLDLIGVAESAGPSGPVRTAMIAGGYNELMMVIAGQRILGRYDVVAVSADAVELKDLQTGGVRRLVLR